METLPLMFAEYGLAAVFAIVLAEQLGLPLPALPVLVMAGALAADDPQRGVVALLLAVVASTIGDLAWYLAGRRHGHRILRLLCRISISPDSCVRQTENTFARRGVATLVIAKFVPGLSTLAPPLAGALGIRPMSFLLFNGAGAALWAGSGIVAGIVFHRQVDAALAMLARLGGIAVVVVAAALALYITWRWWERRQVLKQLRAARISPLELAEMIERGEEPFVIDVRSTVSRQVDPRRIPGALAVDLDRLEHSLHLIPADRELVTYCACPNDASAVQAAHLLHKRGHRRVRPLGGGIDAWVDAGLRLEDVPEGP